jgi:hypothetical protein
VPTGVPQPQDYNTLTLAWKRRQRCAPWNGGHRCIVPHCRQGPPGHGMVATGAVRTAQGAVHRVTGSLLDIGCWTNGACTWCDYWTPQYHHARTLEWGSQDGDGADGLAVVYVATIDMLWGCSWVDLDALLHLPSIAITGPYNVCMAADCMHVAVVLGCVYKRPHLRVIRPADCSL